MDLAQAGMIHLPQPMLMGSPKATPIFNLSLEDMLFLGLVELTEAGKAYRDHRIMEIQLELGVPPTLKDRAGVTA